MPHEPAVFSFPYYIEDADKSQQREGGSRSLVKTVQERRSLGAVLDLRQQVKRPSTATFESSGSASEQDFYSHPPAASSPPHPFHLIQKKGRLIDVLFSNSPLLEVVVVSLVAVRAVIVVIVVLLLFVVVIVVIVVAVIEFVFLILFFVVLVKIVFRHVLFLLINFCYRSIMSFCFQKYA